MRHSLTHLAAAVVMGLAVASPACAEAPFNFSSTPGRLSKTVVPADYTIAVVPNVKAHTLTGTESVVLSVTKPTRTIVFNTLDMTISSARVDGKAARVRTDNKAQLSTVTLSSPAGVGKHRTRSGTPLRYQNSKPTSANPSRQKQRRR